MTNWTLLEQPGVMAVCLKAASKVASRYRGIIESVDLLQEAYIAVATKDVYAKFIEDGAMGGLYVALWADLMDIAEKESRFHERIVPIESLNTSW